MVLRGDDHVDRIGSGDRPPFQPTRIRRLQKSRCIAVFHDKVPWSVILEGWSQTTKLRTPRVLLLGNPFVRLFRKRKNGKLYEKHVPGGPLMWSKGGKAGDLASRHGSQDSGQGVRSAIRLNQIFEKEVSNHEIHESINCKPNASYENDLLPIRKSNGSSEETTTWSSSLNPRDQ